ncbi:MAG: ABC transporter ATP-binding protein [bacterium]
MNKTKKQEKVNGFNNFFTNIWFLTKFHFQRLPVSMTLRVVFTVLLAVISVFGTKYFSQLIDAVVTFVKDGDTSSILFYLIAYSITLFIPDVLDQVISYLSAYISRNMIRDLDIFVVSKLGLADIAHIEDPEYQNKNSRAFRYGTSPILDLVERGFANIKYIFISATIIAIIWSIDWKIILVIIAFSIPSFLIEIKFGRSRFKLIGENAASFRWYSYLKSFFYNKFTLIESKFIGVQDKVIDEMRDTSIIIDNKIIALEGKIATWRILANLFAVVGYILVVFWVVNMSMKGLIGVGSIIFIVSTVSRLNDVISQLIYNISNMIEKNIHINEMFELLNITPVVVQKENAITVMPKLPKIEFRNVSFKYPNTDSFVLKNISFTINSGEKIGLIGRNGVGKTTVVRLLLRIHDPSEGEILINGVNLKDFDLKSWWNKLSVLLQDFTVYNFEIKKTISYGQIGKPIDLEKVKKAAQESTASDYIEKWEKGYDEKIGLEFGGKELSKGEKQKLALARTFYRDADIYILDEPTAAVDSPSASRIFRNIENLPSDKSVLLISHNFATLRRADKIILLEDQSIVEMGTHEELMAKSELYAGMYNEQKSEYE